MQAVLLQLEHQTSRGSSLKDSTQQAGQASLASPSSKSSSTSTRERTSRGIPNGPVDTHSTSNGSSLSSKVHVVSRSQT